MEQRIKRLAVNSLVGETIGPSGPTLSAWSGDDRWDEAGLSQCDEVSLNQLSASDRIVFTTRNHTYEVIVTSPDTGDVMVRGGKIFPRFTAARLAGSTLGSGVTRQGIVNVGSRVQFAIDAFAPIITTPVQTLALMHAQTTPPR